MHLLTKPFLDRFPERIVNVHPSLLPAFPGAHAIDDALAAGVDTTGVTVHYVDEGLDTGAVIAPGARCRSSRARRSRSASTRSSTGCCRRSWETYAPCADQRLGEDGVDDLARGLADLGWELVSSGGTASFLEEQGLDVTRVEEVTEAPEMLGGRVKTLHPRIHAGILARRDLPEDTATLAEHDIEPIDLVCVSLYPFTSVAGRRGATEAEVVEMIDVGGPSMLRAAAKNFAHVVAVSSPDQYDVVLGELREHGEVSLDTRRELARAAFATTAAYEAAIANWFGEMEQFPEQLTLTFQKVTDLSYGENPHQAAAYYREDGARRHLLSQVEQLGGKELSYNNLADLEGARRILREFALPAVVIVKHANPCGVAVAATIEEAWERALAADPVSAFGCVAVLNRPVSAALGARIAEHFVEVLLAPDYDDLAVDALRSKKCAAHPVRPRAPFGDAGRARLQARARRPARAGARQRRRRTARRWRSSAAR